MWEHCLKDGSLLERHFKYFSETLYEEPTRELFAPLAIALTQKTLSGMPTKMMSTGHDHLLPLTLFQRYGILG